MRPGGGEPAGGDDGIVRTALHDFRVEAVADGLVRPFSMAFTPEGDLLVTERPGRLRIIRDGVLLPDSVEGLPPIRALGRGARSMAGFEQAGLRDAILHPDFATNRLLYLSYVKPGPDSLGTIAIARGRLENDRLSDIEELFHADAPGNGTERSSMWGGRLVFDRDNYLFMTLGDRQWPPAGDLEAHPAQNLSNHNGSTIRLHDDGRIPEDNPFVGLAGDEVIHPEIRLARVLRSRDLPAESLCADYAVATALANDLGAERIFSRQLDAFARPGDVLVGCSTSGASRNLLAAFDQAAGMGLATVGLSGYGGGSFEGQGSVHHNLVVQSMSVHRIQEAQAALMSALCDRAAGSLMATDGASEAAR